MEIFFSPNCRFLETVERDFLDAAVYTDGADNSLLCSAGHGVLPGGASPAGYPRPAAPLLHQPRCPTDAGAQELRHEEGRPGQVKLSQVQEKNLAVLGHLLKPKTYLMSIKYFLLIFPSPCFTSVFVTSTVTERQQKFLHFMRLRGLIALSIT